MRARVRLGFHEGAPRSPIERGMVYEGWLSTRNHRGVDERRTIYLCLSTDQPPPHTFFQLFKPETIDLIGNHITWQGLERIDRHWYFQEWQCEILEVTRLRV
jgi:hypothetical protein